MNDAKWNVTPTTPRGDIKEVLELKLEGDAVTGVRDCDGDLADISHGKLDGNDLTYRVKVDTPLGKQTAKVAAVVDGDKFNGKAKLLIGTFDVEGIRIT